MRHGLGETVSSEPNGFSGPLRQLLLWIKYQRSGHPGRSRKFLESLFWTLLLQGAAHVAARARLQTHDGDPDAPELSIYFTFDPATGGYTFTFANAGCDDIGLRGLSVALLELLSSDSPQFLGVAVCNLEGGPAKDLLGAILAPRGSASMPTAVDLLARPRLWMDACDAIKRTCQESALRASAESWSRDAHGIVSTGLQRSWIGRAIGGNCLGAVPPGMPPPTGSCAISRPLAAAPHVPAPPSQAASFHESHPAALPPSESQQRHDPAVREDAAATGGCPTEAGSGAHRRRPSHDAWLAQACLDALGDSEGTGDEGANITVAAAAASAAPSPRLPHCERQRGAAGEGLEAAVASQPGWLKPAFFTSEWWERRKAARLGDGGGGTAQPGPEPGYQRPRPPATDRTHWQHPLGSSLPPLVLTASESNPWL